MMGTGACKGTRAPLHDSQTATKCPTSPISKLHIEKVQGYLPLHMLLSVPSRAAAKLEQQEFSTGATQHMFLTQHTYTLTQ